MIKLENGQKCWAFGSKQYVEAAVQNVVDCLKKHCKILPRKCVTLAILSRLLKPEDAACFHLLVGALR